MKIKRTLLLHAVPIVSVMVLLTLLVQPIFTGVQAQTGPTVTLVTPNNGYQGQTMSVTITGSDLVAGDAAAANTELQQAQAAIAACMAEAAAASLDAAVVGWDGSAGWATCTVGSIFYDAWDHLLPDVSFKATYDLSQDGNIINGTSVSWNGVTWDSVAFHWDSQNPTTVSFGAGITVNSSTVDSATQITAGITIEDTASPGARDVLVTTTETATLTGGFSVQEAPASLPPGQPGNVSPADLDTGVSLTPTLQSSAFLDPDAGDTHAASQWQITTTAGDYSNPAFDSWTDASNLTGFAISSGMLDYSIPYYWHVRYQDNHGAWSAWSSETSFTTAASSALTQDIGTEGGTVQTADGRITAEFLADAVTGTATVTIRQVSASSVPAAPKGFKLGKTCFVIEAVDASGNPISTLSQPVTITVKYSAGDVAAADGAHNKLVITYYDEAAGKWQTLETELNTTDGTIITETNQLGMLAVMAASPSKGTAVWIWIVIGVVAALMVVVAVYILRPPRKSEATQWKQTKSRPN